MNYKHQKSISMKRYIQKQNIQPRPSVKLPLLSIRFHSNLPSKNNSIRNKQQIRQIKMERSQKGLLQLFKFHFDNRNESPLTLITQDMFDHKGKNSDFLIDLNQSVVNKNQKELIQLSVNIFQTSNYCIFNFPNNYLRRVISLIAKNYNNIPYHNFSHAFSLMFINYKCLLFQKSLKFMYTEQQYFYILLSGLAHDINHPGTNNLFQIKTKSKNALIAQNVAVLENMHLRTLWKIFEQNPNFNIISKSKNPIKAKQIITRLILATDMSSHSKNLIKLKQFKNYGTMKIKRNSQLKWFLMQQIFHASDIGNSTCQYQQYMSWIILLSQEFNNLSKLQEQSNLQVTQMLKYKGYKGILEDQTWFLNAMVYPLWKQLTQILPCLSIFLQNIQKNLKKVKKQLQIVNKEEQKQTI